MNKFMRDKYNCVLFLIIYCRRQNTLGTMFLLFLGFFYNYGVCQPDQNIFRI